MIRRPDDARAAWARAETLFGFWAAIPAAFSAELVTLSGADYVCIDQQHGLVDYSSLLPMLAAVECRGALPITRVPSNETWMIGKALDAGAMGVVIPMVSTAAEAQRAVEACKYPPHGVRSFGPIRAAIAMGVADPGVLARPLCVVMVETAEGVANVEAIASTPGLDAIYVGPADLALGLGLEPGLDSADSRHSDAIETIRRACENAGIAAGIQCASGASAAAYADRGFRLVTVAKDSTMLQAAAMREFNVARDAGTAEVSLGYT